VRALVCFVIHGVTCGKRVLADSENVTLVAASAWREIARQQTLAAKWRMA